MVKLPDVDVRIIKHRLSTGERAKDLAEEYGVTKSCISLIQSGQRRGIAKSAKHRMKHTGYEGIHMITRDETIELPTEWTDNACYELVMHAMELGHYGNHAGFLLISSLHQFIGGNNGENRYLKPDEEWDYGGMRTWITQNNERVLNVYKFQVQTF